MSDNTNTIDLTGDATALALVSTIKGAVNGVGKYAAYVEAHKVTRETVKDHALALAVLTYPHEKPVQTVTDADGIKRRTKFGNAVQAAGNGLRSALPKDEAKPTDWLRLVKQAAENAHEKGEISVDKIMAAVAETLNEALLAERDAA